jgi:ABC-type lipoprotein export system ATPase subunit
MVEPPYLIQSLELSGFRAYLQPKAFDFAKKRSLAIFAPNGSGKSSVIDGLEFMLSKDGTLERLGIRAINNNAGVIALAHNRAEEAKVIPAVTMAFVKGKEVAKGKRNASDGKRAIPPVAKTVNDCFTVSPIIRGYSLRTFVESHSPEQRYADVATWLQLGPLVEVQKNVRSLRTLAKAAAEDTDALSRIDTQLAKETTQAIDEWDDDVVIAYVNASILSPLDAKLVMAAAGCADPAYVELVARAETEQHEIGLAGLGHIRRAAAAVWDEIVNEATGEVRAKGAVPAFEAAAILLAKTAKDEADERGKAAGAVFQNLWNAAEPLFADGIPEAEVCPVCVTPIGATTAGSVAGVRAHLAKHLGELADYAKAKKAFDDAKTAAATARTQLSAALLGLPGFLGNSYEPLRAEVTAYGAAIDAWAEGDAPASETLVGKLKTLLHGLDKAIADIEAAQGDHTYGKAKTKVDRLLELHDERVLAVNTQIELGKLSDALSAQAGFISGEIRKEVQVLLDRLQTPMNDIYKLIQGAGAAPIRLELPAEDETNQQRLNLVIDFAENRPGVQPGGYLSDSQIHSMALALRMAAIAQFNGASPILALDDIVTSYDADHRRTIAGLIATMFSKYQIIVTTHDERFFNYLQDQLETKDWQFTRIIGLDPAFGPRFADHKVSDEMIQARWNDGLSAANEMRQAEEEWLLAISRDFGASVRIRPLEKPYSYERSELASALARFLNGAKLNPQPVAGVNNRFLTSLQKGEIENFGSHFQDGPYGDGSIGDERARWDEFKAFRKQFACNKCKRTRFKRPSGLKKPVCAHEGCETQFEFAGPAPAAGSIAG